jgi:O-antigen/teichoic acid export membrane protein
MYVVRLAAVFKGLLLASFLGPSEFGLVAAFLTFLTYSGFLDLGFFHAVYREIPLLRGAGRSDRIQRVVDTAFGASALLGVAAAAAFLLLSALQALDVAPGPWWLGAGLAVAVLGQLLVGVPYNVALSEERFGPLGRALAIAALVDLGVMVTGGLVWGAAGAVILGGVGFFIQFGVIRGLVSSKPRLRWDPHEARRLAAIGIPIALIWFTSANFVALDKVVALVGLGKASLGLYTVAAAAGGLVMVGPVAVASVFGPRILERVGQSRAGHEAHAAVTAGTYSAALVAGVLVAAGVVSAPALIHALLPEYADAARAAQILVIGGALLAITFPFKAYLVGRGAQWGVVRVYLATSFVNLAIDAALLALGQGITGIAAGSLISYAIFTLAIVRLLRAIDGGSPGLVGCFGPLALGALAGAAGSALLYSLDAAYRLVPTLGVAAAATAVVGAISFRYRQRMGGVRLARL